MTRILCGICAVLFLTNAAESRACNVPVFRYALERWEPDRYEILVFYRGDLSPTEKETVKWLEDYARGVSSEPANFTVRTFDITTEDRTGVRELWERSGSPGLPCAALRYPGVDEKRPVAATGPLTRGSVAKLVDSPVRREIARRIKSGESAVWVFLESGDKARDEQAYALLNKDIAGFETVLVLPDPVAGNEAGKPVDTYGSPDMRIDFSIVRVSRSDPAELALIGMLIHTEPDLADYPGEPLAFPVYGRGRVLYALVGEGITSKNIETACRFLIGACSCEVKALNPGVDLLIAADWEKAVTESWIHEDDLPPLVGIAGLTEIPADTVAAGVSPPMTMASASDPVPADTVDAANSSGTGSGRLKKNMFIALGVLFAVTAGLTITVVFRREGSR